MMLNRLNNFVDSTLDGKVDRIISHIKFNSKFGYLRYNKSFYTYEDNFLKLSICFIRDIDETITENLSIVVSGKEIMCSFDARKRVLSVFQELYVENSKWELDQIIARVEEFREFREYQKKLVCL